MVVDKKIVKTINVSFSREESEKLNDMLDFLEYILEETGVEENDTIIFSNEISMAGTIFREAIFGLQDLIELMILNDKDCFVDLDDEEDY